MRRLIVSMNMTLDGFLSSPDGQIDWHFPFWNSEMALSASEQLSTMDTILMGRITYQHLAGYWPSAPPGVYAAMMNSYSKVVVSGSLQHPAWNNTRIMRNLTPELHQLKAGEGKDIIVYGSATTVASLQRYRMVDEYRIWVHPVVIGQGRALFQSLPGRLNLQLLRTHTFSTGVVVLYYKST